MSSLHCSDSESGDSTYEPHCDLPDISDLPRPFRNRVKALKKLQMDLLEAESQYYNDLLELEAKYQPKHDDLHQRLYEIVTGIREPSGGELDTQTEDSNTEKNLSKKLGETELELHPDFTETAKGVPKFWFHILNNANDNLPLVGPRDEAVLEYLEDVVSSTDPTNFYFTLTFKFRENPFFTNQVLTKEYGLRVGYNPDAPFNYIGPEIVGCKGSTINWKEGMDVTKMEVTEDSNGQSESGELNEEENMRKRSSFFTLFSPPAIQLDGCGREKLTEEEQTILDEDFEIGFNLKERILPRAVIYFTGEVYDYHQEDDSDDEDNSKDGKDSKDCMDGKDHQRKISGGG